jgi:U32 family peptidase
MVEIAAPAGDFEMLAAALNARADAVYFGVQGFNMRERARNFLPRELAKVAKLCHKNHARAYLALNSIIYEYELASVDRLLSRAKKAVIDAVICWDMAVIALAKKHGLKIHLSTQASASNSTALEAYRRLGVARAVLARECTLEDIKKIRKKSKVELEAFAHGAMCVSMSGRCQMSQFLYGKSANRGECIQPCRRAYKIIDPETGEELLVNNHFVLSPKDLCTIDIIEKLLSAGVAALKIEGRNRSPEYVRVAVECYKEAVSLHAASKLTIQKKKELKARLAQVYNRGFSKGFYLGGPIEDWADSYGSKSTLIKEYVGHVRNYFAKPGVAELVLETLSFRIGDELLVTGPTTGAATVKIESIRMNNSPREKAEKGQLVCIRCPKVRKNDKVYILKKRRELQ